MLRPEKLSLFSGQLRCQLLTEEPNSQLLSSQDLRGNYSFKSSQDTNAN